MLTGQGQNRDITGSQDRHMPSKSLPAQLLLPRLPGLTGYMEFLVPAVAARL